jgi:hypothetical protein
MGGWVTLLQFMVFFIGFFNQKMPKSGRCKKKPPCQFGQVVLAMSCMIGQSNWTLTF